MSNQIELSGDFEIVCIKFVKHIKESQKYKATNHACRAGMNYVLEELDKVILVDKEDEE